MIKKEDIHKAYRVLREKNHDIPDETLEFIKNAALKELRLMDLRADVRRQEEMGEDPLAEIPKEELEGLDRCPTCFKDNTALRCGKCPQLLCQDCIGSHVCDPE